MSDSDKTLLAAVAMRAKKNAIDQGDQEATAVSITAKVKALSEAGFSDGEIDKILAVEGAAAHPTKPRFEVNGDVPLETIKTIMREEGFSEADIAQELSKADIAQELSKAEYNQQVDETLKFSKGHTMFLLIIIIGAISIMLIPSDHPTDNVAIAIGWSLVGFIILLAINIPFSFKKADYFLKR
ncbi:MAG: hypothetical protein V7699_02680 [Porticoccus sp.]